MNAGSAPARESDERPRSTPAPASEPSAAAKQVNRAVTGSLAWGAAPLAVLALAVLSVIAAGRQHRAVLAENLPSPPTSSGLRVVDLVAPSAASPVLDVRLVGAPTSGNLGPVARLRVQLWTGGRSALLAIRDRDASGSRLAALGAILTQRATVQLVADRGWVDLGTVADSVQRGARIISLTGAPISFAVLPAREPPLDAPALRAEVSDPLHSGLRESATTSAELRFQLVRATPLTAAETLDRLLLFPGSGLLATAAGLIGIVLCCVACASLGMRPLSAWAVCAAIAGSALLHVAMIPPLQNADETSHAATLETIVWLSPNLSTLPYPTTIAALGASLEQERVQHYPDEPLRLDPGPARERIESLLRSTTAAAALSDEAQPPAASTLAWGRSPGWFAPFRLAAPQLRSLALGERLTAYRLGSLLLALGFVSLGAWLLTAPRGAGAAAGSDDAALLTYALVLIVPASLTTLAATTNYSPAVGLGALGAALAYRALVHSAQPHRGGLVALALVCAATTLVWRDAALVAPVIVATLLLVEARELRANGLRTTRALTTLLALLAAGSGLAWALRIDDLNYGAWLLRPARLSVAEIVATSVLILLPAAVAALLIRAAGRAERWSPARRRRIATIAGAAIALGLVAGASVLPHTTVPYERDYLTFPRIVTGYARALLANGFSWDQDVLSWKLWIGVLGWHDAPYPDALYLACRLAVTALLVVLPAGFLAVAAHRPQACRAALLVAGGAASLAVLALAMRHAFLLHPTIRYVLPLLPAIVVPIGALAGRRGEAALRLLIRAGICTAIWGAVAVVGQRWLIHT